MVSVIHVLRGGMVHGVLSRHTRRGPFNDGVGATSKDPWQRLNICEASSRLASSVFHVCIYIYIYTFYSTPTDGWITTKSGKLMLQRIESASVIYFVVKILLVQIFFLVARHRSRRRRRDTEILTNIYMHANGRVFIKIRINKNKSIVAEHDSTLLWCQLLFIFGSVHRFYVHTREHLWKVKVIFFKGQTYPLQSTPSTTNW